MHCAPTGKLNDFKGDIRRTPLTNLGPRGAAEGCTGCAGCMGCAGCTSCACCCMGCAGCAGSTAAAAGGAAMGGAAATTGGAAGRAAIAAGSAAEGTVGAAAAGATGACASARRMTPDRITLPLAAAAAAAGWARLDGGSWTADALVTAEDAAGTATAAPSSALRFTPETASALPCGLATAGSGAWAGGDGAGAA